MSDVIPEVSVQHRRNGLWQLSTRCVRVNPARYFRLLLNYDNVSQFPNFRKRFAR